MVPCVSMILYKMGYRKRNRTPGRPLRLLAAAGLLGSACALGLRSGRGGKERAAVCDSGRRLHGELIHREAIALADSVNTSEFTVYVELKESKGSPVSLENLCQGKYDLALVSGDVVYDAWNGEGTFEGEKKRISASSWPVILRRPSGWPGRTRAWPSSMNWTAGIFQPERRFRDGNGLCCGL